MLLIWSWTQIAGGYVDEDKKQRYQTWFNRLSTTGQFGAKQKTAPANNFRCRLFNHVLMKASIICTCLDSLCASVCSCVLAGTQTKSDASLSPSDKHRYASLVSNWQTLEWRVFWTSYSATSHHIFHQVFRSGQSCLTGSWVSQRAVFWIWGQSDGHNFVTKNVPSKGGQHPVQVKWQARLTRLLYHKGLTCVSTDAIGTLIQK